MRIKKLYRFILKTFLPLFAMTFFIVLFIVLMQFLWRYIDDLVGKGLGFGVIAELFFYAAVSMVPMALPLAILLASLMTFGNLGEKFELTAMKASGISLLKIMSPLIILVGGISVGAFFFQNDVLPKAQVKMWTLLFSMRQKSPELEIPAGVFYDQIPGYNLLVREKDQQTGMLRDVMIYDVGNGGDNATILLADSARLAMTPDMSHLYLHMMGGEQFDNLRRQSAADRNVPFRREEFLDKEILIPFDANFNRMDEQGMRNQYVGKNISQLRHTIDSVSQRIDSIGALNANDLRRYTTPLVGPELPSQRGTVEKEKREARPLDMMSTLGSLSADRQAETLRTAQSIARSRRAELQMRSQVIADEKKTVRRHGIEFYKKFTLSVACLVFFFIGAPLGAIIRKGGLGTPLVISILLFLFYYVIDNTGYKMARDGRWAVWAGMWLSSVVLAPLGIYVTWKAMNDSAVFDKDLYLRLLHKALGSKPDRHVGYKEVIIDETTDTQAVALLEDLGDRCARLMRSIGRARSFRGYWEGRFPAEALRQTIEENESAVDRLTDSRNQNLLALLPSFPVIRALRVYRPVRNPKAGLALALCLAPLSLPLWLYARRCYRNLQSDLKTLEAICAKGILIGGGSLEAQGEESAANGFGG